MNRLAWSVLCAVLLVAGVPSAGSPAVQWQIVWQTTGLDRPVAAIYAPVNAAVYVVNQNGEPWTGSQDFIAKLDPTSGEIYRLTWNNYTYTLNLFSSSLATPGPLGSWGPTCLSTSPATRTRP